MASLWLLDGLEADVVKQGLFYPPSSCLKINWAGPSEIWALLMCPCKPVLMDTCPTSLWFVQLLPKTTKKVTATLAHYIMVEARLTKIPCI